MVNEFHNREFVCSAFVPGGGSYDNVPAFSHVCSVVGAVAGSDTVSGTRYIEEDFSYYPAHLWRYESLSRHYEHH